MFGYLRPKIDKYLRCGAECFCLRGASTKEPSPSWLSSRVCACYDMHAAASRFGGLCGCCCLHELLENGGNYGPLLVSCAEICHYRAR